MSAQVLVVEDDQSTRAAVRALLEDEGFSIVEAVSGEAALDEVRKGQVDMVVLDLGLPTMSGADVHQALRRDPRTRYLPVVLLTARTDHEARIALLEAGADDYIAKPYDAEEFLARVRAALRRATGLRAINPLSGLPGNRTIMEEIESRLVRRIPFALLYVDIDHFKEFNDHYGFARGDQVITALADLLTRTVVGLDRFVGHIGGDDFVALVPVEDGEALATRIASEFDELVPRLYDEDDRVKGAIVTRDRRGALQRIPLATLSIGVVTVPPGHFDGAISAARAAAEVKEVAKRTPGSSWAVDRRRG